jgi:polyvinyl alcohol dehydrogenase (cytochrome)
VTLLHPGGGFLGFISAYERRPSEKCSRKKRLKHVAMVAASAALLRSLIAPAGAAEQSESQIFQGRSFDIPDPAKGGRAGEIYLARCAACHDEGIGRAPQRLLFVQMSPRSIYRALVNGAMRAQGQGMSEDDKITIAEFLTRKKLGKESEVVEPPTCQGRAAAFDFNEPPIFPNWGLSPGNTRFIPMQLAGINRTNVGRLHLKWALSFPDATQVRSQPALAAGALYVGSHNGNLYALDRMSGCARWIYQAGSEVRGSAIVSSWKAGDRHARPLVYFGDVTGVVYAVDARDGKLVWRTRADDNPTITLTGTPTLRRNTLYVPVSTLEGVRPADPNYECCTARGAVVALDAANGELRWKTYTTPTPTILGTNDKGVRHYGPAGASVWNSPAIDVKRNQLYVGTGNNSTSPATGTSDAIMALDLDTGAVRWVYQGLAGDATNLSCTTQERDNCPVENGPDLDFGAGGMLVTTKNGRQIVIGGQKSGEAHAIDPDSGKLIWKVKPGRGGGLGGVHFSLAANDNTVFVPINDVLDHQHNGQPFTEPPHPGVYAFDLTDGRALWSAPADPATCVGLSGCTVGYSQAITATPDLVIAGNTDGWLRVFDAQSGSVLWQIDAKQTVKTVTGEDKNGASFGGGAGPVLYHGMLFASSGYNRSGEKPGNLLLVFEVN